MPSSATLALSRVSVRFADEKDKLALRAISFVLPTGSFVSLAGPSGAGKSTLLRVILGLMPPDSGDIVRRYDRPAMVFQDHALFPWLSTLENVCFGLKMRGVGKKEREKIAREKLAEVGLARFEKHFPVQLSGGQRQRVSIARALAINPDFLIMDEPFSSLDSITSEALKQDIMKIWQQYRMTILMVNHLIPDAVELSDSVILMSARPGEIKKHLSIDLPRPRDTREARFYRYVDELTEDIRRLS